VSGLQIEEGKGEERGGKKKKCQPYFTPRKANFLSFGLSANSPMTVAKRGEKEREERGKKKGKGKKADRRLEILPLKPSSINYSTQGREGEGKKEGEKRGGEEKGEDNCHVGGKYTTLTIF